MSKQVFDKIAEWLREAAIPAWAMEIVHAIEFELSTYWEPEYQAVIARALVAERERAAKIAFNGCLVPPDGGSPTQSETEMCDRIATAIRGD